MRMNKILQSGLAIVLAICLLLPGGFLSEAALAEDTTMDGTVRVYLSSLGSPSRLDITICGSYSLDGSGATALANGSTVTVGFNSTTGQLTLTQNGVTTAMGTDFRLRRHTTSAADNGVKISQARVSGNLYPGDLQFKSVRSGGVYKLYTIAHVFIEDYLCGVLPYEMGNSSPLESLKAQCVSARTYTVRAMNASTARSYDVVDTTNDQVYNGTPSGNVRCVQAVQETRGLVSMNGNAYTATYYTASNGGQIESVRNIWGSTQYDYITVKDDPYDYQNPASVVRSFQVNKSGTQSNSTLGSLLNAKAQAVFGTQSVSIESIDAITPHTPRYAAPSRLYTKLDFDVTVTANGTRSAGTLTFDIFSELETPLNMGINAASNELWTITATASGYTVQARRFGHGTGMSQRGAMRMGELGYRYDQILSFYFSGCRMVPYTFVRTILSEMGSGASTSILTADTPALPPSTSASTGVIQTASASGEVALRVAPDSTADIITGLTQGTAVTVHAVYGDWYLVTCGILHGYVQKEGLQPGSAVDGVIVSPTTLVSYGTVKNTSSLNLRAQASLSSSVLAQIPAGTVLPMISISGDWGYTQYGCQSGYVNMGYIAQSDRYTGNAGDGDATGATVIAADGTPLRMSASLSGYTVLTVPEGALVKIKHDDGAWAQVYYGGFIGYVLSSALQRNGITVDEEIDTPKAGEQYAVVNSTSSSLNLRTQPNMSSTVMAEIPRGEKIIVESVGAEWCRVRYHGVTGYCASQYLQLNGTSDPDDGSQLTAVVTTEKGSLNLRKSDSTASTVLTTIPRNATIPILQRGYSWSKTTYGGFTGYVMNKYLRFNDGSTPTPIPVVTPIPVATPTLQPAQTPTAARVTTVSGSLNLRSAPVTGNNVLAQIPQYATVEVLGITGTWTQVRYGVYTGYVMSAFLTYLYDTEPTPILPTPTPTPAITYTYARVTTQSGSLNLRARATTSGEILDRIPQYELVLVLERQGLWTRVSYNGKTGYVMSSFLSFVDVDGTPTPAPTENTSGKVLYGRVTTVKGSLNMRERASSNARVMRTIPQYETVTVLSRGYTWSQVTYQGATGYVMSSFLTFFEGEESAVTPTPAPAPVIPTVSQARVTTVSGPLNLRASIGGAVLKRIPQNDIVQVVERGTVWTQVTHEGTTGYVKTEFLTFLSDSTGSTPFYEEPMTELATPIAAQVTPQGSSIYLRAACDENATPVAIVLRGEYVLLTARGSAWCRIDYDGQTGYLPTRYLNIP